jgi:POT family proton-dependent oligopeptide transporter
MGINLGSLFASLLCAWLGETYGWGYGFGAAGIGMIAGLITFVLGKKHLMGNGEPPAPESLQRKVFAGLSQEVLIYAVSILSLVVIWQMVQRHSVVEVLLLVAGGISLLYILYQSFFKSTVQERNRLLALTILILFSVVFWALFEQAYSSIALFTERIVDRGLGSIEIAPGMLLSLNSFFIILLAPLFAWIWVRLTMRKRNPNAAVKFGLAILMVGFGFGALVLGDKFAGDGKIAMIWLVVMYLLHTIGELFLSPVGLSYVTKLSPVRMIGFMMGVWFLATAGSEYIAVLLAKISSVKEVDGEVASFAAQKAGYISLYESLFYLASAIGAFLLLISPLLKRMMHGVDDETEESLAAAIQTEDSELLDN